MAFKIDCRTGKLLPSFLFGRIKGDGIATKYIIQFIEFKSNCYFQHRPLKKHILFKNVQIGGVICFVRLCLRWNYSS